MRNKELALLGVTIKADTTQHSTRGAREKGNSKGKKEMCRGENGGFSRGDKCGTRLGESRDGSLNV